MSDDGMVEMCEGLFETTSTLEAGTPVKISVDFDDVIIHDDEEDGTISATVVSSIYKGSYYQCIVRTDDYYDFFVDTDYDWLKDDRVGISIAKDKIIIEEVARDEN
jgi:spermidine/putrescine transport system ATP-binding protein